MALNELNNPSFVPASSLDARVRRAEVYLRAACSRDGMAMGAACMAATGVKLILLLKAETVSRNSYVGIPSYCELLAEYC